MNTRFIVTLLVGASSSRDWTFWIGETFGELTGLFDNAYLTWVTVNLPDALHPVVSSSAGPQRCSYKFT